jgi:hypothetical protein
VEWGKSPELRKIEMIHEFVLKTSTKIAIALILFVVSTISALAILFSWKLGELSPVVSIPAMMLLALSIWELAGLRIYEELRNDGVDLSERPFSQRLPGYLIDSFDRDEDFSGEYLRHVPEPVRNRAVEYLKSFVEEFKSDIDYVSGPELTRDEALALLMKKKSEVPVHELCRLQNFLRNHDEFLSVLTQNPVLYSNAIGLLNQNIKIKLKTVAVLDEPEVIKDSLTTQTGTTEDSSEVRDGLLTSMRRKIEEDQLLTLQHKTGLKGESHD